MKPLLLKFSAFGPYVDEQVIDFSRFSSSDLFLIHGKTGSGKTVILDAITYALYGRSSGGHRGDILGMRCQFAPTDSLSGVEFTFLAKGAVYKFTRILKCVKKRGQGGIEYTPLQSAHILNSDGEFEPLFENPRLTDVNDLAVHLIGLNYEQFRQVVILPQGQFERLLIADSKEKQKILTTLFGVEKYDRIADILKEYVNEQRRNLEDEKLKIGQMLSSHNCKDLDGLQSLLVQKEQLLLQKQSEQTESITQWTAIKKEYETARSVFNLYTQLESAQKRSYELSQFACEITSIEERLNQSKTAEKLLPAYHLVQDTKRELTNKQEDYRFERTNFNDIKKQLLLNVLQRYTLAQNMLKNAERLVLDVQKRVESAEKQQNQCFSQKLKLEKELSAAYETYSVLFKTYLQNIAGTLAAELKEGQPCPVCGNTHHPHRADGEMDRGITDNSLNAMKETIETLTEQIQEVAKKLQTCEEETNRTKTALTQALLEKERLAANLTAFPPQQLESAKQYMGQLKPVHKTDDELHEIYIQLAEKHKQSEFKLHALESEGKSLANRHQEMQQDFNDKLQKNGYASQETFLTCLLTEENMRALTTRVEGYTVDVAANRREITDLQEKLGGCAKPDLAALQERLTTYEKTNSTLTGQIAVLNSEIKSIQKLIETLSQRIQQLQRDMDQNTQDIAFAKQLKGDTGISLQRYVLGVKLSCVAAEANRLLSNVHGGRYQLYRTLEGSGKNRKVGLELEVLDSHSGGRRSVLSLSGGEKFLVALSLAMGLSCVVQAQSGGIQINAMFIDEGFGTLDEASLTEALFILSNMKQSNCLVGIISHVGTLRECISHQIHVSSNNCKSSLTITG